MEVERISTTKVENIDKYRHEFEFKNALPHIITPELLNVIRNVFKINSGYYADGDGVMRNVNIVAYTTDTTPNNAINRSAWILRQLDKLIGLKLED